MSTSNQGVALIANHRGSGIAIIGSAGSPDALSPGGTGVQGRANGATGIGVHGYNTTDGIGIKGEVLGGGYPGIFMGGNVGINITTPTELLHSVATNTAPATNNSAIKGENLSTNANGYGVQGSHAGNGAGIYGTATGTNGIGVFAYTPTGIAINGLAGSGAAAVLSSATGNALVLDGPVRVSGSRPAAFVVQGQTTTPNANGYVSGAQFLIDNAMCNNDPNAILIVTHRTVSTITALQTGYGVFYNTTVNRWFIYMENAAAMPGNAIFNVMIIKQ
jgi:hypothetical protein